VPPEMVFAKGKAFLDKATGPWFLWLHLMVPHEPYRPPAPFVGKFGSVAAGDTSHGPADLRYFGEYPPEQQPEADRLRLRYDEFIAAGDAAFGDFVDTLDRGGTLKNTALLVSADHGENFGHGYRGHGGLQLWEPVVHIPLILRLPDRSGAGTRIAEVVGQVDIAPTVLDLAGVAPPAQAEGRSLRPVWEGRAAPTPLRFSFFGSSTFKHPTRYGLIAVHEGDRKFVLDLATGKELLFDRATDRAELHDRAAEFPDDCARYRREALAVVARHDHAEAATA
jgi:arylsulfatase A-like enzyme